MVWSSTDLVTNANHKGFLVRRLSSVFLSLATLAGGVFVSSAVANAASGAATVKTSAVIAPSSIPNAKLLRITRLAKTNSFLAVAIDSVTAGANAHLYKIKEDLTIDSSFKPVDLGSDFSIPTSSNSSCMQNNSNYCWSLESFNVNETAGVYTISMWRNLSVSSGMGQTSGSIQTIAMGKIATGAVTSKVNIFEGVNNSSSLADWSAYNPVQIPKQACESTFGSTYQGVSLEGVYMDTYGFIRPDGSFVANLRCFYSADNGSSRTQYETVALLGLKPSGSTLVLDTSWGTNGAVKTFDDPTLCGDAWGGNTTDSSITANSAQKIFAVAQVQTRARVTTYPWNNSNITSYNGCETSGARTYSGSKLLVLEADGSLAKELPFSSELGIGRWIIDPNGRWTTTVAGGTSNAPTTSILRLTTKGELDTSLGANGQKLLSNLASSITVNGTSVRMRYNLSGIAKTAKSFYFTGFSSASTGANSWSCGGMNNSYTTYSSTVYPYYLTVEDGLVTTYGTSGLGEGVKTEMSTEDNCNNSNVAVSYINGKGQHASLQQVRAIGTQTAGIKYTVWDAAEGVISGGDGTGTIGGGGRTDAKVYSKSLPKKTQEDTAFKVLTKKQAADQDLRSITPKVCVAISTDVLMINPGKCVVQIVDEDTRKVLRSLRTTVAKTEREEGSTLTTDEPIMFKQASNKLSATAQAQVKELAGAASAAKKVVVIGHSAALADVSQYSYAISRERAAAVKAALVKAGVKASIIETVALSYNQPISTKKSTSAQEKNRRVEVFILE